MIEGIEQIKNIIFDFGGVIINIDYNQSVSEFRKIGLADFWQIHPYAEQTGLFDKLEKGIISAAFFRDELRKFIPSVVSDIELDRAWNAMLLDIPPDRIRLLERLKTQYRTFLLSNTNAIHYDYYTTNLQKEYNYRDFSMLFGKDYFSHKIGMRKPEPEIFELVINENGLSRKETLFIDDMSQNVEGAKKAGLLTYLLPPHQSITSLF